VSKIIWKDWNPQRVKAMVAGEVVQNMEVACQFVAGQAKAIAISRRVRAAIDIEIETSVGAHGNVIEGLVGVRRKGAEGKKAFFGYFLEMGTRFMAARPFLRPAVFNNAREIVRIIAGR
jgi:HK97 gp10 family phage protein